MRAFITKFALTKGVFEVEGDLDRDGYLVWKSASSWMTQYTHKRDFCLTIEEALVVAESARVKELQSLDRKIKRLGSAPIKVVRL